MSSNIDRQALTDTTEKTSEGVRRRWRLTTSHQILIGLGAGIGTGLFFVERVSFLNWPAKGFVDLLQITVLPYIVGSIIVGIGINSGRDARRLAIWGGLTLLITWAFSLSLVFMTPFALPSDKGGVFFSAVPSFETAIDWLDLYIPANPFRSLANNTVPAVVIFSILVGVALIDLPKKERIIEPMKGFNDALARVGVLLVKITPIGIFAVAGHAAGTMRFDEFQRLEAFFLLYIGLTIILALWILPGMISVVTGISNRRILSLSLDAVITAFVTSSVFIVLPMIAEKSKLMLKEVGISDDRGSQSADVLIPASFNFPHSAKILSLSFVVFAGWFAGTPVSTAMYPVVASVGLLSFFGSLNTAIPFLLNMLRMPTDLFQMFLVSGIVNSHFGSGAAVMHTLAIAIVGSYLIAHGVRIHAGKMLRFLVISILLIAGFLAGSRILLGMTLPDPKESAAILDQLKISGAWGSLAEVKIFEELPPSPEQAPVVGTRLDEIVERGVIRVGYIDNALPWCFRNSRGELVGFDIGMAHALAVQMQVKLELMPVTRENMGVALKQGLCDIIMSGIRATPVRAKTMQFSKSYFEETAAFLVPDHLRESFAQIGSIQRMRDLKIAVLNIPSWIGRLRNTSGKCIVKIFGALKQFVASYSNSEFDAQSLQSKEFSSPSKKPLLQNKNRTGERSSKIIYPISGLRISLQFQPLPLNRSTSW